MNDTELERLERYLDGTLDEADAADVARRLAGDEEWARAGAEITQTREALRGAIAEDVGAADFGALWDRIDAALPAKPVLGERLRAWWAKHWTPVLLGAAVATAAAVVVVRSMGGDGASDAPGGGQVKVDAVHNDGNKTVLISQPAEGDDNATVIWLLDGERGQGGDGAQPDGEDPI
jgi:anti-sigma factor RsiW